MNKYEIIVVGGGPAGMMAEYFAAQGGKSVALFEKKDSCGRKILLTGKGRCNITNSRKWEDFKLHIHPDSGFYKNSFYHFSNQALVEFLTAAGLEVVEQRGERIFPASEKSSDVRDTLVNKLKESPNIDIITNSEVVNVETRPDGHFMVSVMNDEGLLKCEYYISNKVIMCTGGLSYPATGSTGDGYRIAKLLKHNVVETTPSLTALKPYIYDFSLVG
ncbi:MAG: aminoacetone oxidase family FAD-binding enzyme, partial [Bacteroidales bacterium]|nr:aminoacetone oxidase family FAD-binding enzyme [Bacteroidales bacterium]